MTFFRFLSFACLAFAAWASPAFAQQKPAATLSEKDFDGPDSRMFNDTYFLRLKPGVNASQVARMTNPVLRKVAADLLAGRFDARSRARVHEAYEPVDRLARRLKTSAYDQFENPTGIYFGEDDAYAVVCMSDPKGEPVRLRVREFGRAGGDESYPLKAGVNVIRLKGPGLGYISYYTENFATAPKLNASVLTGKVNGVFDPLVQDNTHWKKLLESAVCEVIDIRGRYVHLVYPVKELRQYCPEKGEELIGLYDRIIHQQHEIMGLVKYKILPRNRMLGRVIWNGYMHADGFGAAFHNSTMAEVGNPDRIPQSAWGIAHEFGHVNQTRPGMKWVSTTEVTNNIFSSWTNYQLNPGEMRLEHEAINGGDGHVRGGRFNAYLNSAIVKGEQWLCQQGPDKMQGYEDGGDHFVKLGPLWQLQLYFGVARMGRPDFYADVFQKVRETDDSRLSNGELQLNFMRNVCDIQKQNLTEFFYRVGMLKPIDKELDDYSRGRLTITKEQAQELVRHASKYPKPASPVIYYISANSVDAYKRRAPVQGTFGKGVSESQGARVVNHDTWKNVVVFEVYKDKALVKVAMVGTGSKDNSSTRVAWPEGATRMEAVAWNGQRTLVTGAR